MNKRLINQKKREYRKKESESSELVISMYGSFIGKNQQGITVKVNGKSVRKSPSRALEHIIVTSRGVSISSDAIQYCMENRIPIDFFDHSLLLKNITIKQ
jgi:CRISPR/Cas system-associated endonuclease Cas1